MSSAPIPAPSDGLLSDEAPSSDASALQELGESIHEVRDRLRHYAPMRVEEDDARDSALAAAWSPVLDDVDDDERQHEIAGNLLPTVRLDMLEAAKWSTLVRKDEKDEDENDESGDAGDGAPRPGQRIEAGSDGVSAEAVTVAVAVADAGTAEAEAEAEAEAGATPVEADTHTFNLKVVKTLEPLPPPPTVKIAGRVFEHETVLKYVGLATAALILIVTLSVELTKSGPTVREHFLAIEEGEWDYNPTGRDECHGRAFDPSGIPYKFMHAAPADSPTAKPRIGRKYLKARYVEYTDATFTVRASNTTVRTDDPEHTGKWQHLGFLGPLLRAEVGDVLRVTLRNKARFSFSLHAEGAFGDKKAEGAGYRDGTPWYQKKDDAVEPFGLGQRTCERADLFQKLGRRRRRLGDGGVETPQRWKSDAAEPEGAHPWHRDEDWCHAYEVLPGENRVYEWPVREEDGPGPSDGSSALWTYQSHVGGQGSELHAGGLGLGDTNAGLLGAIIVTKRGHARNNALKVPGTDKLDPAGLVPKDVDDEFVTIYTVTDENDSPYLADNVRKYLTEPAFRPQHPGYVSFGPLDKARVLMKLYEHAVNNDKLSYADAQAAISGAGSTQRVETVRGHPIRVWFNEGSFDPTHYDAAHGIDAAAEVVGALQRDVVDLHDPLFVESNMMHSVNGRTYCTLPGLDLARGKNARWYVGSVGSTEDLHSPHWHGNTGVLVGGDGTNSRRADAFEQFAGGRRVMDMTPENPGEWLYHCHINDHITAGMNAKYTVTGTPHANTAAAKQALGMAANPTVHQYYVQAEPVEWEYYPQVDDAVDKCSGLTLTERQRRPLALNPSCSATSMASTSDRIGTTYTKVRYVEYSDSSFAANKKVSQPAHLGILGPTLRAAVGDVIRIKFKNHASNSYNFSMHPHGVFYAKGQEGAPYADGTSGADKMDDLVAPGATFDYEWLVPASAGPAEGDPSSIVWMYHSHADEVGDTNAGLVGAIVVSRSGVQNPPTKDFVLFHSVLDEGKSTLKYKNLEKLPNWANSWSGNADLIYKLRKDDAFKTSNKMHSVNGKLYCQLSGLDWAATDSVRLHFMSLGDEMAHAPALEGHTFLDHGIRRSALGLMAASMVSVDVSAHDVANQAPRSQPGKWLMYDGASDHLKAGLKTHVTVTGASASASAGASTTGPSPSRTYYIAADEVEWDYGSHAMCEDTNHAQKRDVEEGTQLETGFEPAEQRLLRRGHHRIGSKYVKAQYRQYTGSKFNKLFFGTRSRFNSVSEHLALAGPVLEGEVGDVLKIVFRNKLRFPANMHVHGGVRNVAHGAARGSGNDPTSVVPPGEQRTYFLQLTAAGGPAAGATNKDTEIYAYASQLDFAQPPGVSDALVANGFAGVDAGLFGALIVHERGYSAFPGLEMLTFFHTVDENKSPYIDLNILKYAGEPVTVDKRDPVFKDSNRMSAINGNAFCNLPGINLFKGKPTRWYQLVLGNSEDWAAPKLYGTSLDVGGSHVPATQLMPGQARVADFTPAYKGRWLLQSATAAHSRNGMQAMVSVADRLT